MDGARGSKVWFQYWDRELRFKGHFGSIELGHQNPCAAPSVIRASAYLGRLVGLSGGRSRVLSDGSFVSD